MHQPHTEVEQGLLKVLTHEVNKTALLCRMPECLISTYQDNMPLAAELKADFEWAKSIAVGPGLSMNGVAAETYQMCS